MTLTTTKYEKMNSLKSLISNGNTKAALVTLIELTNKENKLNKEALILKAKFEEISKQHSIGIADNQEYNQGINKINYGILEIEELLSTKKKPKRILVYAFTIVLVMLMGILLGFLYLRKPNRYNIHIYQLSHKENYNEKALKHLISEFNAIFEYTQIIFHNTQLNSVKNNDYGEENYSVILNEIQKVHKSKNNEHETVVVLIDFSLNTKNWSNLFAVMGLDYSVLSTWGLQSEHFSSENYDSFILRYILLELINISASNRLTIKGDKGKVHSSEQFRGCLLDFMKDKTEIIHSIDNPKFCLEHELIFKESLGRKIFNEYDKMIKSDWINEDTKEVIERRYKIKM